MTKVFKITLFVVDHDNLGPAAMTREIECARYPNDCVRAHVIAIEGRDVEWSDEHPLNNYQTQIAAAQQLFETKP